MCGEVQRGMRCRKKSIGELSRQLADFYLSAGDLLDQKGGGRLKTMTESEGQGSTRTLTNIHRKIFGTEALEGKVKNVSVSRGLGIKCCNACIRRHVILTCITRADMDSQSV